MRFVSEATARVGSSTEGSGSDALTSSGGADAFSAAMSAALGALKALGLCHGPDLLPDDLHGVDKLLQAVLSRCNVPTATAAANAALQTTQHQD